MSGSLRASIDIGSNTFRLLIAEPVSEPSGAPWCKRCYTHRIVRLGEGLHHSGRLSDAGMNRALQALHEFAELLRQHDIPKSCVHAVATAAMREAENGELFRQRVLSETGIDIRIIDGEQEASMSLAGSCAVLAPDTRQDMLLFDIGGGSTEFVRAADGKVVDAISRKLGVVRLVEAHLKSDPPSASDFAAMKQTVTTHLAEVETFWGGAMPPKHLVGTAGTVTTLAAVQLDLYPYDVEVVNNYRIGRPEFTSLRDRLLGMTHAERETLRTIEKGRADLIIAGLSIIETIMQRWSYQEFITVDAGLLEGVWLNAEL